MYRAYHINYNAATIEPKLFFDVNLALTEKEYALIDPAVKLELGKAGSFTFTLPVDNIEYDQFVELNSFVELYRVDADENEELIFSGRVFGLGPKDFYGKTKITCEGLLAIFNDTIFPPGVQDGTLSDLIERIIENHNSQIGDAHKMFRLGNITVSDDYTYRDYQNYDESMKRLSDLADSYGGYMIARVGSDGYNYLDYIDVFDEEAEQHIDFGENLLDIEQEMDVSEIVTVLYPFGAEVQDEDEEGNAIGDPYKIDIRSVNDDVLYIENEEAIAEFGRITKVKEWDDVTEPINLKQKAIKYLADICKPKVKITVSAVDMAKYGSDFDFFRVGDLVHVRSEFHNLDKKILLKSQELKLLDPASNTMSLEDSYVGYVGRTNKNRVNLNHSINLLDGKTRRVTSLEGSLQQQIIEIREAGFINEEGVAGLFSEKFTKIDFETTRLRTDLDLIDGRLEAVVRENNEQKNWLTFDQDGLTIGHADSPIKSVQDHDTYKFVDSSGGNTLLEINIHGVDADSFNAKKQVAFDDETGNLQWAIRKGNVQNGKYNLNDVWIG